MNTNDLTETLRYFKKHKAMFVTPVNGDSVNNFFIRLPLC